VSLFTSRKDLKVAVSTHLSENRRIATRSHARRCESSRKIREEGWMAPSTRYCAARCSGRCQLVPDATVAD